MSKSKKDEIKKEEIKKLSPSKKIDVGGGVLIHGDTVSGDKISGDHIFVGDISNSAGVAIGSGAYAVTRSNIDLIEYMRKVIDQEDISPEDKGYLIDGVTQIQGIISSQDGSNNGLLNFIFRSIKSISLSVFEILGKRLLTREDISLDTKRLIKGML